MFFFSPVVFLFWSKVVCLAVCRLELNAADWNLNCDLAVANCESAAELPVKPLSPLHSRFLFVGWFVSFSSSLFLSLCHFVLVFVISKVWSSLLLSYLMFWTNFSVHKKRSFYHFPSNMGISVFQLCYSFKGPGQSRCCNSVILCFLTVPCVTFSFLSYESWALSLMLYLNVDECNLQSTEKMIPLLLAKVISVKRETRLPLTDSD